ncbi:calphotin-like isoform X3 [Coregonus clupeaformis]|uniref:calphotin-like isoform X3 n=1 Tax=Coregonus clupeaformis TaxID=59861 RepID=UPI001E1C39E3|nr:calphotin-like isoform X3 [Coregonus clupeaformis]
MPSKRKKNKRRMRRVQAQRRVLEEQHAAGTGKGTPGVAAVAAPPVNVKEVAKCPKLVPIQTQVVSVPVVALLAPVKVPEPKPVVAAVEAEVVAAEVEVEAPVEAPVEAEVVAAEVEVEAPVEAPVEAEEATLEVEAPIETPDVVDGPVEAPEEVPVVEVEVPAEAPVGPPTEETSAVQEVEESVIPKTELVMEAASIPEAPVSAPAEFEVQVEDSVAITTEIAQDEPVMTEAPEEVPVETEIIPETPSEPVEAPVEAPVAEVAPSEPLGEAPVDPVIDRVADDFIVTESVLTVEAAMAEPAIEEQVPAVPTDALEALSESRNDVHPVPEPAPVTADEVIDEAECEEEEVTKIGERDYTLPPDYRPFPEDLLATEEIEAQMEIEAKKDAIDENTALDVLSGDFSAPQPVISELQCHTQLISTPVELATRDIPAEAALNGHMATEVAIEG